MYTTVKISDLSNLRMVAGNENKYDIVIMNGILREWVGIGWIDLSVATEEDKHNYPIVE